MKSRNMSFDGWEQTGMEEFARGRVVAAYKAVRSVYSDNPPFHPGQSYPEYEYDQVSSAKNAAD